MYPVAVVGSNPTAQAAILACRNSGFEDITWVAQGDSAALPAATLPANFTRIIAALGGAERLTELGHVPDREQVRFATSGFLLSELPLGKFAHDRYGAPHVNIAAADLNLVLETTLAQQASLPVDKLAQEHGVVLICTAQEHTATTPTHELWHAQTPYDPAMTNANITWLGRGQSAWQLSTPQHTHYFFSTPAGVALQPLEWHPNLRDALSEASCIGQFDATASLVREHWHEGNVAYLGEACYRGNVYRREGLALGLEDAWVVSRMLENYEEDIADGLAAYEKYRRPRALRMARATAAEARQQGSHAWLPRLMRNLNIAFSTRFIPEIAMHRIDWMYNYDCIRGFR